MGRYRSIVFGSIGLTVSLVGCAGPNQGLLGRGSTTDSTSSSSRWVAWRGRSTTAAAPAATTDSEGTAENARGSKASSAASVTHKATVPNTDGDSPFTSTPMSEQVSARVAKYFPMFNRGEGAGRPQAQDAWADQTRARMRSQSEPVAARERPRAAQPDAAPRPPATEDSVLPVALQITAGTDSARPRVAATPRVKPTPAPPVAASPEADARSSRSRTEPVTTPDWAIPAASVVPKQAEPGVVTTAATPADVAGRADVPEAVVRIPVQRVSDRTDLGPAPIQPVPAENTALVAPAPSPAPAPAPESAAPVALANPTDPAQAPPPPKPAGPAPPPPAPKPAIGPAPPPPTPTPVTPAPAAAAPAPTPTPTVATVPPTPKPAAETPPAPPAPKPAAAVAPAPAPAAPAPAPVPAPAPAPESAPKPAPTAVNPPPITPAPPADDEAPKDEAKPAPAAEPPAQPDVTPSAQSATPPKAAPAAAVPAATPPAAAPAPAPVAQVAPAPTKAAAPAPARRVLASPQSEPAAVAPAPAPAPARKTHRFGLGLLSRWFHHDRTSDAAVTPTADVAPSTQARGSSVATATTGATAGQGRAADSSTAGAPDAADPANAGAGARQGVKVATDPADPSGSASGSAASGTVVPGDPAAAGQGTGAAAAGASPSASNSGGALAPGYQNGLPPVGGGWTDRSQRQPVPGYGSTSTASRGGRDPSAFRRDAVVYPASTALPPSYLYPVSYYNAVTTPASVPMAPPYQAAEVPSYWGAMPGDAAAAATSRRPTLWSRFMNRLHGDGNAPDAANCPGTGRGTTGHNAAAAAPAPTPAPAPVPNAPPPPVIPLTPASSVPAEPGDLSQGRQAVDRVATHRFDEAPER